MSKLTPAEQGFVDGIRSVIEADQLSDDFVQLAKEMINEIIASTPMLRARIPLSSNVYLAPFVDWPWAKLRSSPTSGLLNPA